MNRMKDFNKIVLWLNAISRICVLILVSIQLLGIWKDAINVVEPLLGVLALTRGTLEWKKNKSLAKKYFTTAVFVFLICIYVLIHS